ncbi:unnamed protein product [Dibothriocephalus latus]|uniref:Uncharacterized protein n=1 Tax=Dibothriocephalus latus TaxID=60516 RepID=A0A3P7N857_DIBLA|nr:unnamed protein product [Dibothriocephalus latus]
MPSYFIPPVAIKLAGGSDEQLAELDVFDFKSFLAAMKRHEEMTEPKTPRRSPRHEKPDNNKFIDTPSSPQFQSSVNADVSVFVFYVCFTFHGLQVSGISCINVCIQLCWQANCSP